MENTRQIMSSLLKSFSWSYNKICAWAADLGTADQQIHNDLSKGAQGEAQLEPFSSNTFLLLLQWCFRFVFTSAWHAVAAISFADLKKSCQYKKGNSFFGVFLLLLFCRLIKYLGKWELNRTGLSQLLTADYLNLSTASDILHLLFFQF